MLSRIITYCILTVALLLGVTSTDVLLTPLSVQTTSAETLLDNQDEPLACAFYQTELALSNFGNEPVRSTFAQSNYFKVVVIKSISHILHSSKIALKQLLRANLIFTHHQSVRQLNGYYLLSLHKILI